MSSTLTCRPACSPKSCESHSLSLISRCVRLHVVWTSGRLWYFDVISRKWCGHDYLQTTFWNINHHHLSYYSPSGEVSDTGVGLFSIVWVCVCVLTLNLLFIAVSVCVTQVCHPEPDAAYSKTSSGNRHSIVWESLQSSSHRDLDHHHFSHRHVRPRHGGGHQCYRRHQRLLHLYFSWYVNNLKICIVCIYLCL